MLANRKVVIEVFNLPCCKIFYYSSMGKNQKISHRALWQGKLRILMLSLEVCKRILGNNDNEEVKMIREYLYLLATLQIECENNVENQILD